MPATWPKITDNYTRLTQTSSRSTVKSPDTAGVRQTRSRHKKARKTFRLEWKNMTDADMTALTSFFENTVKGGASSFNWTDPDTTTYECRFDIDKLRFVSTRRGYWALSVTFTEV